MAGNDFAKFAVKAANMAAHLQGDMDAASLRATQKVTDAAKLSIRVAAGGDSKMSGLGKKSTRDAGGAEVTARYKVDVQGTRGRATTYLVYGTRPLWMLDNPTKPHWNIKGARKSRAKGRWDGVKRQKSKKSLESQQAFYESLFGGGDTSKPLKLASKHPGTKGKRSFWKGVERVEPLVPRWIQQALSASMTKRLV
jgi:hypothetical protein